MSRVRDGLLALTLAAEEGSTDPRAEMVACPAGSYGEPTPRVPHQTTSRRSAVSERVRQAMPVFALPTFATSLRTLATTSIGVASLTTMVLFGSTHHVVHADAHTLRIQSSAFVGPLSGLSLAPAVRIDVPGPADIVPTSNSEAVSAVVNRSTCRRDLDSSVMTITIPDISYTCPVYAGGQTMLNSGAATMIDDEALEPVLADHPGGPGLLWIAGHRVSHGGAFAEVPSLADGALITVSDGTYTATYRVVGRSYVGILHDRVIDSAGIPSGQATLNAIIRPDHGGNNAPRLLLQTCDGDTHRWMIYADLVTA
jgi:sortase (surface protein transpeptidase)